MYAIESKENFEKELTALLAKIGEVINSTRSMVGTIQGMPSNSATSKINSLKLQEYKLKEISVTLVGMEQAEWEKKKDDFQKEFLSANDLMINRKTIS